MGDGEAPVTAQQVAAHRLTFDRVRAPYGAPKDDDRLARDVATGVDIGVGGVVARYLGARTLFFDRVLVGALDRGIAQVVVVAAGYDGRALRYAKPGVRWFELDHPDTQQDKRRRLAELAIDTGHIAFVAVDLTADDVAAGLRAGGLDAAAPTLFLVEGVAADLEAPVLDALLRALRSVAADGSRLAISLSTAVGEPEPEARRSRFRRSVEAVSEPAQAELAADGAAALLAGAGWREVDSAATDEGRGERARAVGFVLVETA